jgi:hypothetical protein
MRVPMAVLDEYRLTKEQSMAYTDELLSVAANRKAIRAQENIDMLAARNADLELRLARAEGLLERVCEHVGISVDIIDFDAEEEFDEDEDD